MRYLSRLTLHADRISQHLGRVRTWIHLIVGACNRTVLTDEIADALGRRCPRVIAGAVRKPYGSVRVAQQRKGKGKLLGESGILLNRVEARPDDRDIQAVEVVFLIAEPATLGRSTRGVGFRVKPE